MKKLWLITFLTISLLLLALPVNAATEGTSASARDAGAFYNAQELSLTIQYGTQTIKCENAAIKDGDITYLPLREVLAAYGADISWAVGEAEDKVIVTAGADRYQMVVDLKKCEAYGLNDKKYTLKHKDDTLYLPVVFYADLMNCTVSWDRSKNLFTVNDSKKKKEATIFNPTNGGIRYKKVMNLPAYQKTTVQKTVAPVVSRSEGLATRSIPSSGVIYQRGMASYYAASLVGNRTASGEALTKAGLTAAHKSLPFGTIVRVTAQWNGRSVDVRINDRGPYAHGRVIDLSYAAAQQLGMVSKGVGEVTLEVISSP